MKHITYFLILSSFLFLTACGTITNNTYPQGQLFCPSDTVEFCEGRTKQSLECQCVNKRALERQLRNINF